MFSSLQSKAAKRNVLNRILLHPITTNSVLEWFPLPESFSIEAWRIHSPSDVHIDQSENYRTEVVIAQPNGFALVAMISPGMNHCGIIAANYHVAFIMKGRLKEISSQYSHDYMTIYTTNHRTDWCHSLKDFFVIANAFYQGE